MEANKLYQDIQDLTKLVIPIAKREPDAIKQLASVYYSVFKETFSVGCKSCPTKAYGKLQQLSLETLITMQTQKFKLKKNALINFPAFSGQHYSHHNITDDKAIEILTAHPSMIENFEAYPTDESGNIILSKKEEIDPDSRLSPEENQSLFNTLVLTESNTSEDYISAIEAFLADPDNDISDEYRVKLNNKLLDMKAELQKQPDQQLSTSKTAANSKNNSDPPAEDDKQDLKETKN